MATTITVVTVAIMMTMMGMSMVTAVAVACGQADGMVWGRRQGAKAAEMGINRK